MAFDSKRLRTFKWLETLANGKNSYCKKNFPRFPQIMVYCGSLYATDEIVLAKIDYPEFEHLSDYIWSDVTWFTDDKGLLLKTPVIADREKQFINDRIFDQFFKRQFQTLEYSIDPRVLDCGLKVFKINKICPVVYTSHDMVYLMGHNNDVSIRVAMMGTR